MGRLWCIVLLFVLSVNSLFAEGIDSVRVSSCAGRQDTVVTDSSRFVISSILLIERDKSRTVTYYGHVALRLQCPSAGLDYVFTFTGDENRSWYDAVMGRDLLALVPTESDKFFDVYNKEGRDVYEYTLNLTLAENRELWRLVDKYVKKGLYLQDDCLNHGCAQETASLVLASIDGTLKYGPYVDSINDTQASLSCQHTDADSWLLLMQSLVSGPERNRKLSREERLFVPSDMIEAWKDSKIIDGEGRERNIFKSASPVCYTASGQLAPQQSGLSAALVLGIVLGIVLVVSLVQLLTAKVSVLAKAVDGVLLWCVTLVAVAILLIHLLSHLPIAHGWTHSFVVFNLVPLAVYLVSLGRPFTAKTWMCVYGVYSVVLLLLTVWLTFNMGSMSPVELLSTCTLLLRCVTKAIINHRLNSNNTKQKEL